MTGEARFRAEKSFNRPQLLLFEFVAGRSLLEISPDDEVWRNEQVMEEMGLVMAGEKCLSWFFEKLFCFVSFECCRDVFLFVFFCLTGDVVLNNLDRLPLPLWDNEGNLGNLLIQTDK